MTTVTKESQIANMLRTCTEALKQVTAERNNLAGELKALRDSGVELPSWTLLHRQWPDSYWYGEIYGYTEDQLRDYGDRRTMAERERAAKVCEDATKSIWECHPEPEKQVGRNVCTNLAEAIRKGAS